MFVLGCISFGSKGMSVGQFSEETSTIERVTVGLLGGVIFSVE